MESRKRAHSHEDEPVTAKKRIVLSANSSPRVNGMSVEPDELDLGRNLELFRKEAIYRRMKHYSRENERNLGRIAELERRKNTCEAGLAAVSACWAQLVEAIKLLLKPDDLVAVTVDIFDLTVYLRHDEVSDISSAVQRNFEATQSLVTKFAQMRGTTLPDAYRESQRAQTECAALRSELELLRAQLKDSEALKEQYHVALISAENRIERVQSSTVMEVEKRGAATKEESEEPQQKPSSPAPALSSPLRVDVTNGSLDVAILQQQLNIRDSRIADLEKETLQLRDQLQQAELKLRSPTLEHVMEHSAYKILQEREQVLRDTLSANEQQIARLIDEQNQLQTSRREWEESVLAASTQSIQEFKTMLSKREVDNARLRDQREQLNAEVLERKQKEIVKSASVQEYKTQAESRSERIITLESEVKRLKSRLAAEARDEDLMKFIFAHESNATSIDYINILKNRASTAEKKAMALEQSLASFEHDHPDVTKCKKMEAETRQKLAEAMVELEKYQRIHGGPPLPLDLTRLAEQLKQKDEELQQLRLVKEQQSQAEASLYMELEKLSTSWEALDRQVKNKVFDLSQFEERLSKSGVEKAKSENKFFAAMRDKEAVDVERKNLSRNLEKQAKLLERLYESERNLRDQVADLEKEIVAFRKACAQLKRENQKLFLDVEEVKIQAEHLQKEKDAMRVATNQREVQIQATFTKLRATEDDLVRARKEVEQQVQEWRKTAPGTSQNKTDGEVQNLKELLRCSTCKTNFRNTIITKCMHTFCKQCVEARITTRQRKCPACNILFSQSDVQTLWFQ